MARTGPQNRTRPIKTQDILFIIVELQQCGLGAKTGNHGIGKDGDRASLKIVQVDIVEIRRVDVQGNQVDIAIVTNFMNFI